MPTVCFTPARGRVARLTRVNDCGFPVSGPCSTSIIKGFVSIENSPQQDEGEPINVVDASGEVCASLPACPTLTGIQVTINFCRVDPEAFSLATGQRVIYDAQGNAVGFGIGSVQCDVGFALEVWTDLASQQALCGPGGQARTGYILTAWITGVSIGDYTIENGAVTFTITGTSRNASGWGVGPYDVQLDAAGVPGPLLEPVPGDEHQTVFTTEVPPPTPVCGCLPLEVPLGLTVVEDTSDPSGFSVIVTWNNSGFGPVTIDYGNGDVDTDMAEFGQVVYTYTDGEDGPPSSVTITVTDEDDPSRTASETISLPWDGEDAALAA